MPGSSSIILNLREYIFLSLKELPLIAGVAPLFLGITQGNMNLLMLAFGCIIIAPTGAGLSGWLLKLLLGFIDSKVGWEGGYWKLAASDVSPLLPESPQGVRPGNNFISVTPTYWLTIVMFFFSYLLINAVSLYTQEARPNADPEKVNNRKSQSVIAMIMILVLGIFIIAAKVILQGGETVLGVIVAGLVGGPLAYGWFNLLKRCGTGRLEDVFGIQARILPEASTADRPIVCLSGN